MKKAIIFMKFDEQGKCKGQIKSAYKYTVREAMAHLEANGFVPMYPNSRKLHRLYRLNSYTAYITQ